MRSQGRCLYATPQEGSPNNQRDRATVSKRPEGSTATQKNVVGFDARAAEFKVGENGVANILRQWEER